MPIYEEKLLSPLAIHFTQDHIRTTFRDHREVEAAVDLIEAAPGQGSYDVILKAPFPNIEILRWHPKRHGCDSSISGDSTDDEDECDEEHWFTLDNRRLYCLQRAAVSYWPQRVAAVVEVLYVDPGSVRRKYDSKTCGRAVTIAHSLKGPQLSCWDWRKGIIGAGAPRGCLKAVAAIREDDDKAAVDDLSDAPQQGGLMATLAAEAALRAREPAVLSAPFSGDSPKSFEVHPGCPTPSTTDNSDSSSESQDSDSTCNEEAKPPLECVSFSSVTQALAGSWVGNKGETYKITLNGNSQWQCVRSDAAGTKRFSLFYEAGGGLVWWGNDWSFYADAQQAVSSTSGQLAWYAGRDKARRKARFSWLRVDEQEEDYAHDYDAKAAEAISEILEQLWAAGGYTKQLWIPQWTERFQAALGSLRRFLESRPDAFVVTPGQGRQFTVSAVRAEPKAQPRSRKEKVRASAPIGTIRTSAWTPTVRHAYAGTAW